MKLILASKSARRQEILRTCGVPFTVLTADVDETLEGVYTPEEAVRELAQRKAHAAQALTDGTAMILCADTVVALDGVIYGKPRDEADAVRMLRTFSGRVHEVYTGYALLLGDRRAVGAVCTKVHFRELTDGEILHYVRTQKPFDKAGAYGIQEAACLFVRGIEGDYFNVVGLPASAISEDCRRSFGMSLTDFS